MPVNQRLSAFAVEPNRWSHGWSTPRDKNLCRRYRLSYMPLGVIGDMYEQAGNGGGQILSADRARLIQGIGLFAQVDDSRGTIC
jgi:hypothetical protein